MKTKKAISANIREAIGLRAYHIWESEGRPEGREHLHWLLAEEQILSEQPSDEAPLLPHHAETVMAVPVHRTPVETNGDGRPVAKTPKVKKVAAKNGSGAKKKATPPKTKKTAKPKPAVRPQ